MAVEKPAAPAVNGKAQAEPSPAQPRVDSFDAATATTAELAASLKRNGCLYLRGLIGKADMDQINQDMRPHLDDDTPWDGACFPPQTKRLSTVVAKSTAFRQKVLMNQQWLDLSKALLNVTTGNWFGDTQVESTAEPILGNTVCFRILPGAAAQGLHRDSMVYHLKNPACTAEEYTTDRDTSIGIFLAGTRTTRENGATRFCPGSHLEQTQQPPSEDRAVYAEMEPGDALIMFSSVYHAGSANVSQSDERLVYNAQMTKGFMRTVGPGALPSVNGQRC